MDKVKCKARSGMTKVREVSHTVITGLSPRRRREGCDTPESDTSTRRSWMSPHRLSTWSPHRSGSPRHSGSPSQSGSPNQSGSPRCNRSIRRSGSPQFSSPSSHYDSQCCSTDSSRATSPQAEVHFTENESPRQSTSSSPCSSPSVRFSFCSKRMSVWGSSRSMRLENEGFHTFHAERFWFSGPLPIPVLDWLRELPTKDSQQRFPQPIIDLLVKQVKEVVGQREAQWAPLLTETQAWALFTYSAELFEDVDLTPPSVSWQHQLYSTFNTICREYGQCEVPPEALIQEWDLFHPFAFHFDAAIRALPPVSVVLYRGMSRIQESYQYPIGMIGSWGGCMSASSIPHQAARFICRTRGQEVVPSGSFFMILSDGARCISHLSLYPEEAEHLHPLNLELEVCNVLPTSILQMLALNISILTFKRAGAALTLDLCLQALEGLGFVFDDYLASFIPPFAKDSPYAAQAHPLQSFLEHFLKSQKSTLLITSRAGMGKTSTSLWLARKVNWLNRTWLFVSLPSVIEPFAPNALAEHIQVMFGFSNRDQGLMDLQRRPLVLILDSLDEVPPPRQEEVLKSWIELNNFDKWNVRLVVTCRDESIASYGMCVGQSPMRVYLDVFGDDQMREYIERRLKVECGGSGTSSSIQATVTNRRRFSIKRPSPQQILEIIRSSPMRHVFRTPFKLSMAVQLLLNNDRHTFDRESSLYEAWLQLWFQTHCTAGDDKAEVWVQAEKLAWELHIQHITHDYVATRGRSHWFRACPLRIHDYNPDGLFSFQNKSIQEYLVARYLYHQLEQGPATSCLTEYQVTKDFPVLRFFGGIFAGRLGTSDAVQVRAQLFHMLMASQHTTDRLVIHRAANSISLLNAARVSFQGQDLSHIVVHGANLQGADFRECNLSGADLTGADMKGVVLDAADLSGANLTDVSTGQLLRILARHEDVVSSVALSGDGSTIVSGSLDMSILIWNTATGALTKSMMGHTSKVRTVAVSENAKLIASGCDDGTIGVWCPTRGHLVRPLNGHEKPVRAVALSPDGGFLVSGSDDQTVRYWKTSTGAETHQLTGHTRQITGVALAFAASLVASSSRDCMVMVWDTSGNQIQRLKHEEPVTSVAISVNGLLLISGCDDRRLYVWNPRDGKLLRTLVGHTNFVVSVALTADGSTAVSGSDDNVVRIWRTATGELIHTLEGHTYAVNTVAISSCGDVIVSGSNDLTVRVWQAHPGELLFDLDGPSNKVSSVAISADGTLVAAGGDDSAVHVWDAALGDLIHTMRDCNGPVNGVALAGQTVAAASHDKMVRLWDAFTGKLQQTLRGHTESVNSVALSQISNLVVSGSSDKTVRIWRISSTGMTATVCKGHNYQVTSVALSHDDRICISGSFDKALRAWDVATGRLVHIFSGHTGIVRSVAMAGNGSCVVSGAQNDVIRFWDPETGTMQQKMQVEPALVVNVSLSHDAERLVASCGDMVLRVWQAGGDLLYALEGHRGMVRSTALTADGTVVVSGSYDKTVRIWNLGTGQCRVLRAVSVRSLQFFAHSCVISDHTVLSCSLKAELLELGAVQNRTKTQGKRFASQKMFLKI